MKVIISKSGHKVPVINNLPLHSKMNPLREAGSFFKNEKKAKTVWIVLGLGFAYHLEDILNEGKTVYVVEPNPEISDYYLNHFPKTENLNVINASMKQSILFLEKELSAYDIRSIGFKVHQPSFNVFSKLYQEYKTAIENWLSQKGLNTITDSAFGQLWTHNILKNLLLNPQAPQIKNLSASPIILLGSGYSLIQAIPFLKRYQKKLIILVIPPALELLKANGISADMLLIVDGGYANRFYLQKLNIPLLGYFSSSHLFIKNWGARRYFLNSALPLEQFLASDFPVLPFSGSVANTALEFSSFLSDTIYISGFDFCYSKSYYHYPGNPLEKELLFNCNYNNTLENSLYNLMRRGQKVELKNQKGEQVFSNLGMQSYYQDFNHKLEGASKRGKSFYLLSEEGAFLKQAKLFEDEAEIKSLPFKKFEINSFGSIKDLKEKLYDLKEIYLNQNIEHPVLKMHLSRYLIKGLDYELEIKKTLEMIEQVLKRVQA